jgi:hypothetical protein
VSHTIVHGGMSTRFERVFSGTPLTAKVGGRHGRQQEQSAIPQRPEQGICSVGGALLDDIGEEHMTQSAAAEWSIKDIVAYMTGWRRSALERFQAVLCHEPPPLPPWPPYVKTTDEINVWIYASNRDRTLAEALLESHGLLRQLMDMFSAFSEAELLDPMRFPWLEGEPLIAAALFAHLHEGMSQIGYQIG